MPVAQPMYANTASLSSEFATGVAGNAGAGAVVSTSALHRAESVSLQKSHAYAASQGLHSSTFKLKLSVRSGIEPKPFDQSDCTNPNREYALCPVHYRSSQPLSQSCCEPIG